MISSELIRQFQYFEGLNDESVNAIAAIAKEEQFERGKCFYETDEAADALFLLLKGSVENYLVISTPEYPNVPKEYFLGEIQPGQVFGLSAMLEPYTHSTTTRASREGTVLRVDAAELRQLCENNPQFGYTIMKMLGRALKERLHQTRRHLAATRSN